MGARDIRTLSPREIHAQQVDGVRVAPGIWRDRDGGVHFSIPELLDVVGLPHTPEHVARILTVLEQLVGEDGAVVIQQEEA